MSLIQSPNRNGTNGEKTRETSYPGVPENNWKTDVVVDYPHMLTITAWLLQQNLIAALHNKQKTN